MNILNSDIYSKSISEVIRNYICMDAFNNKTIVISGATGLICSCITDILLFLRKTGINLNIFIAGRNREKTTSRFLPFKENKDYKFVFFDAMLENSQNFKNIHPNYIIHGASNAHPKIYANQPVETMMTTLQGTYTMLKFALNSKKSRFVYISSSEVYGIANKELYFETDYNYVDILNPRACYPSSKRAAETLCASFMMEYNLDVLIVRPGHIYGPTMTEYDSRAVAQFIRHAIEHKDIVMKSQGKQRRSYCYVVDCATAILTVLIKGEKGSAYNISNKNSIASIYEVAEAIANMSGIKIVFENATDYENRGYNLMKNSVLGSEKLERLGWRGVYDLEQGISATLSILKEKNHEYS